MTIYTVQPGDTVYSIAKSFNIPYMRLVNQNIIQPNFDLVVGQNLVITYPEQVYNIQNGDTLESIAHTFGVSELQLMQINPHLSDRDYFYIGEEIIIRYAKDTKIDVNGYAFSFINVDTLKKTLPMLTYLSILGYQITDKGDIIIPNDQKIIEITREYGVIPLMMCSTLDVHGGGSYEVTHHLLNDKNLQEVYINNILLVLKQSNLAGINFGCQFILKEDLQAYINLMAEVKLRIQKEGYLVFISILPFTFGFPADDKDASSNYFYQIGQIADRVILISYQWTNVTIPLVEQTTVKFLEKFVQYAVLHIPSNKILIGITRVAYDWEAPYTEDKTNAILLSNTSALDLAYDLGVNISFDEETQTPYFYYTSNGIEHFVWFKDPNTINSILNLIDKYNLKGISVWSIMDYGPATWTVINSQYNIDRYDK